MALENYRITEFQEKTQVDNGDYVLIDSATDGTHKYQLSRIPAQASAEVAAAVSTEANTRHQADMDLMQMINQERSDRAAADGALQSSLSQDIANVASTLGSAVSSEAGARAAADAALNNAIEAETTAREEAVTALAESVGAEYAKKDGSYADMTAGNADQLLSTVEAVDSVPYQYRTSGGTADIGDREYDTVVGGTVAWNQLIDKSSIVEDGTTLYGLTITNNGDGTVTVNGTVTDKPTLQTPIYFYINANLGNEFFHCIKDHKYLLSAPPLPSGVSGFNVLSGGTAKMGYVLKNGSTVVNALETGDTYTFGRLESIANGVTFTNYRYYYNVFDITQMFGTTIADYIYSLETATAGAGVAFFRSLFPNDYYPYDAGSLKSVEGVSAHETIGFNAWDEEWRIGSYNSAGVFVTNYSFVCSKNPIRVLPNHTYSTNTTIYVWFYDADMNFIESTSSAVSAGSTFTIPNSARYIHFRNTVTSTTYSGDICINLSWSGYRNGEYEPYVKHTYPLDDSLTLRGIPKLDSANHLYYDGDTYEADGTVTRRYGIVDLGTLTWASSTTNVFTTSGLRGAIKEPATYSDNPNIVCPKYMTASYAELWSDAKDKTITVILSASGSHGDVWVRDSAYSDPTAFKTAMSGVYLVYELATPTTEEADPYQSPQIVDDFGTEEYITTSIVPVGHYTKYPENLRAKIEGLPWDFSTLIAPTEKTNTATRNYTSGSLLIMGNVLYKATANIANGGTITPGTNVTATTLSEVISALS